MTNSNLCLDLTPDVQDEFYSEVLTIVKQKKTFQLVVDEGWHSESELKELGWSAWYP